MIALSPPLVLLEMVTMFCTYAICGGLNTVYQLGHIGLLSGHVSAFRFRSNNIQENKPERAEQQGPAWYVSACNCLRYSMSDGSTVDTTPHPPKKAQPVIPRRPHYVAQKKWPIFTFRFWGDAA